MTDSLTDRTARMSLMTVPVGPARLWSWEWVWRWLRPGYGSRANAREACRQLGSARQRTLALAWQAGHPSAVPPCGHVPDLHQCPACTADTQLGVADEAGC